jgi:hypothetical protein
MKSKLIVSLSLLSQSYNRTIILSNSQADEDVHVFFAASGDNGNCHDNTINPLT